MSKHKKYVPDRGIDGPKEHPESKQLAREGYHWVRHALTGQWVEEADWTPWACSVASEAYFCS